MCENESIGFLDAAEKLAEQCALAQARIAGDADPPWRAFPRGGKLLGRGETEVGDARKDRLPADEVACAIVGKALEHVALRLHLLDRAANGYRHRGNLTEQLVYNIVVESDKSDLAATSAKKTIVEFAPKRRTAGA